MAPVGLRFYAGICGWTLARAHARSGDPIAIAAYLGEGDQFDRSITDFAQRYADQNEQDYQTFAAAIRSGRLEPSKASRPESFVRSFGTGCGPDVAPPVTSLEGATAARGRLPAGHLRLADGR